MLRSCWPSTRAVVDTWLEGVAFSVATTVFRSERSPYQLIEVASTALGRMLILDGTVQCAEADEKGYHELLVHVPMLRRHASRPVRRVLVIGGGDGGAVREVLRHEQVRHVDLVDIDEQVIATVREALPSLWPPSNDSDGRLHTHWSDALDFVTNAAAAAAAATCDGPSDESPLDGGRDDDARYDLIIVDATDPVGPGASLYTDAFYTSLRAILQPGGAVTAQSGSYFWLPTVLRLVYHGLRRAGFHVRPYHCFSACYPSMFNLSCATLAPRDDPAMADPERAAAFCGSHPLQWYSAETHAAAFALPPYARAVLAQPAPEYHEAIRSLHQTWEEGDSLHQPTWEEGDSLHETDGL